MAKDGKQVSNQVKVQLKNLLQAKQEVIPLIL